MSSRAAGAPPVRRRYRSALRQQQTAQTRQAVLAAAHELFVAQGWAGTGMRDVAARAGVALETVYAHFSSKRGLLRAVGDIAAAGDEQPLSVADRPEFAAIGRGRRRERIRSAARVLAAIQQRTAPFAKVVREAAPTDEELAEVLRDTRSRQRVDLARASELIVGRPPTPVELDGLWAITSPEVFLLLTDESGWSASQYEDWMAETLERVIPRS